MMKALAVALSVLAVGGVAQAKEAANGEPATGVPFQVRHGWFAETQLGVFTAFGGEKTFSNGEPWVALSFGLDIPSVQHLTLFFTAAHGSNAGSCHALTDKGDCLSWKLADGSLAAAPENFSVMPLEVGLRFGFGDVVPRLSPYVVGVVGYSIIIPGLAKDVPLGSPHAGGGFGVEYVTRLDGLTIGAEVVVRAAFAPFLATLSAYPRIKYVF